MNLRYTEPLVTVVGGAGYIGSCLVRMLLQNGYCVRVLDNLLFGSHGIDEFRNNPQFEFIEGDIRETHEVSQAVSGADVVVLLAAIVGHRSNEIDRRSIRDVNFLASNVVLEASYEHGVSRFVFASSDSIYGTQSGIMYETALPEPVSSYSRLKLRMEERVINAERSNFHPTALRIGTCYGYSPRMRFDLVPNSLVRDAVIKKQLKIIGGDQCRAFIHVEDAAKGIFYCIKAHSNLISGEVFNLSAKNQALSIKQLVNIVQAIEPEVNVTFEDEEPDLVDYHLACSKIEKVLDFLPAWEMRSGMEQVREKLLEGVFSDPYSLIYSNT